MKAMRKDTRGGLRGNRSRWSTMTAGAVALLFVVLNLNTAALAQSNEIGNVEGYAPKKTISDYEAGSSSGGGDFDYGKVDLRVGIWLDRSEKEIYERGEEMGVGFQTNQDAYAVVYRIDVEGQVTVLWPRSRLDDGFAFGGHEYLLPVAGARQLRVGTDEGEGFVEAIVSKYPFDLRDLEIDFHHEPDVEKFRFMVAGDPFLAMNEVNYAITGLENSEEYVVTNYTSYYVHRQVDHPRYLCNQCHFEDEVAYEPYRDTCTLEIKYDYGWVNSWYTDYGYYPVYANPVYVYVDPWTWRPWINFWYWPSYTCAPYYGYGWYGRGCYSWGYSPYYAGDCYTYYNSGNYGSPRYKPLTQGGGDRSGPVTKTQRHDAVTRMVSSDTPDSRQRDAMSNRTRMSDSGSGQVRASGLAGAGARGTSRADTKVTPRERPRFDEGLRVRGNSGLRIRDGGTAASRSRTTGSAAEGRTSESGFRHRAGGGGSGSGLVPVNRGSGATSTVRGGSSGSRTGGAVTDRKVQSNSGQANSQRSVKPSDSRKRGTRVWNSGRSGQSSDRNDRTRQVRPGSSRSRSSGKADRSGSSGSIKPSSRTQKSSGSKTRGSTVKPKSGSSRNQGSSTRNSSSVGNKSSSKSGGSRSSGRTSGGSRSSGGGSKGGSRGGGTSGRR